MTALSVAGSAWIFAPYARKLWPEAVNTRPVTVSFALIFVIGVLSSVRPTIMTTAKNVPNPAVNVLRNAGL